MNETKRKFLLAANWKCNGTTAFVKDIITHLFNSFEYDKDKLGIIEFHFLNT